MQMQMQTRVVFMRGILLQTQMASTGKMAVDERRTGR
jgi:hypothetical protein